MAEALYTKLPIFFFKPKNLPYNPAIQFLGIYPGEMKASINKKTCT